MAYPNRSGRGRGGYQPPPPPPPPCTRSCCVPPPPPCTRSCCVPPPCTRSCCVPPSPPCTRSCCVPPPPPCTRSCCVPPPPPCTGSCCVPPPPPCTRSCCVPPAPGRGGYGGDVAAALARGAAEAAVIMSGYGGNQNLPPTTEFVATGIEKLVEAFDDYNLSDGYEDEYEDGGEN